MGGGTAAGQNLDLTAQTGKINICTVFSEAGEILCLLNLTCAEVKATLTESCRGSKTAQRSIFHVYLLRCENTIPDVELADGANKGLNRVEALAPLVLVLT